MYRLKKILVYFKKNYVLDVRALALMRIAIGLIVITDLIIRASDLTAHYTNEGMWSTEVIKNFGYNTGYWSLHALSGNYWWIVFLFAIHFIFAIFLIVGYKTKLSTLIVWLLLISLHNRNLFILQSGDDLLRLLLFWGLFLPWANCYSIDCKKTYTFKKQFTVANLGYLLLIASVYFFTVHLKTSTEWHAEGSAIYYALSLEQMRLSPFGDWLYKYPALMQVLTWFVFYTELSIPFLILIPTKKGYLRLIAVILITLLHVGIGLTLYVGLFNAISIALAIGLLPCFIINKWQTKLSFFKIKYTIFCRQPFLKFGKTKQIVLNYVAAIVIVLCLILNLSSVKWFNYELRSELYYPINILRLNQYWGMFSPNVLKKDGWFVYYGIDSAGRQWDVCKNQDYVDFTKPKHIVNMYKNDRWRKLAENMQSANYTFLHPLYGKYILKQWNKKHPNKKIVTLNLYFMSKQNLPNYKTTDIQKNLYSVCIDN